MITYFIITKYGKDISRKNLIGKINKEKKVMKWEGYLRRYHYLGHKWIVGESLRYVVFLD